MGSYVEVAVEVKHETEKAVLVFDGDRELWIPKSQIENTEDIEHGKCPNLMVSEWFANKEGLI